MQPTYSTWKDDKIDNVGESDIYDGRWLRWPGHFF